MKPFDPDFELIKMDAEIGSYQEDYEPRDGEPERVGPEPCARRVEPDPGA